MQNEQYEQKDCKVISVSMDKGLYQNLRSILKSDKTIAPRHSVSSYIRYLIWRDLKSKEESSGCHRCSRQEVL